MRSQIEAIAVEFPRYGYRRITAELGRRGYYA
ncbi:MAG: IS3 family transposase [Candidatus Latescibacteria bacterium]|nr:IS3 family transposase [Candidatus Latescibacterota bacterium]